MTRIAADAGRPVAVRPVETVTAALGALLLGSFLLFGAGFAQPEAIHDAAHDGRHSFAFPCH
ncbi:CbtB domain-containing protein [Azospirillum halopraeferens]|uniref:CbtB domain-containing protein n=1 Tax=Azospirillum halopraeferens TaxID=34010 RepID=UPI0003FD88CF|nr:CbtB domain-containing protein [Azospirillum halopraeferens]